MYASYCAKRVHFAQYGVPRGFVYNSVQYFYITNQLGDIIGITDSTGKAIVEYTYDEWGNPIQTITRDNTAEQNKIAEINPLRYRGYYYDTETGYYYLQSRYYNPEWGRFISPDSFGYIDNSTRLGFNAYIYCVNNPIMYIDPNGKEATNNWFEASLKVLCLGIEIDTLLQIFENFIQIVDNTFDLNTWFINLTVSTKDFFENLLLYLTTGLNSLFKDFWNIFIENSVEFSFKKLIDEPLDLFSKLPKLSWDVPAIKFAPVVGSIFSIFDIINSVDEYGWNSKEGIILVAENVLSIVAEFIPVIGSIISAIGDLSTILTNIYFKFDKGEYI